MSDHVDKTIAQAQQQLKLQEEAVVRTKQLINQLCGFKGGQPLYGDAELGATSTARAYRGDEFLGKTQHKAARAILKRRFSLDLGPATTDEIVADLISGGYEFQTKDEANRKRGVFQTLSKGSSIFHRIPSNGRWGLLDWYPEIRARKARKKKGADDDIVVDEDGMVVDSENEEEVEAAAATEEAE